MKGIDDIIKEKFKDLVMKKIIAYVLVITLLIPSVVLAMQEKMYEYKAGKFYGKFDSNEEAIYRFALTSRKTESEEPIMWDRTMDDYYFAMLAIMKIEQDNKIVRAYCSGDINGIIELKKDGLNYEFYKLYVYQQYEYERQSDKKFKNYIELLKNGASAYDDYYRTRYEYLQNEMHGKAKEYNMKMLYKIPNNGYLIDRIKYHNIPIIEQFHSYESIEGYFLYYNALGFEYDNSNVDIIKYESIGNYIADGIKATIIQNKMYPEYENIEKEYYYKE